MKSILIIAAAILLGGFLICCAQAAPVDETTVAGKCITCHKEKSTGLYQQWHASAHAAHNVTCYDCHHAERGDKDAYMHEGGLIATLVTPKDCAKCHTEEAEEVEKSYHATAGQILESNDAYLAHVAGGLPAAVAGCESCHGSKIELDSKSPNKLARQSWPNSGIGRINPDGSLGSCTSCHTRHLFSKAQARQPETCGKCHLGPDHPQKEIYDESKHGNTYHTNVDIMNLKSDQWVVGQDYFAAPTCATCHMSATMKQDVTHDVGQRISWTLRPIVSKMKENWKQKRENMIDVCITCHARAFADGHYYQFDGIVNLYNEKFARPAFDVIKILKKNKSLPNKAAFSNEVEWIFWELWHHEGRRARHGAAMMGPDYTWWHGIYDVVHNFYFDFIPAVRELDDAEANAYLDKLLADDPMHVWLSTSTDDLKAAIRSGELQKTYKNLFKPGQVKNAPGVH